MCIYDMHTSIHTVLVVYILVIGLWLLFNNLYEYYHAYIYVCMNWYIILKFYCRRINFL